MERYNLYVDLDNLDQESILITDTDVIKACRSIRIDTAPGEDGVRMKVIRELKIYKAISYLATYMLRWGYVPLPLKHGRTILIFKNGDPAEVKNWRPITIFSLICRIVERINDTKFRMFLCLNAN